MRPCGIITMMTDFGLEDPYVAMMKGIILGINPRAQLVDITHRVRPGDILQGARVLVEIAEMFPRGTVHLGVVDPGVGGARRPILARCDDFFLVGPDNGLFWPLISGARNGSVIHLSRTEYFRPFVSSTFHGRDIFAPVAAHLLCGVNPSAMGVPVTDPVRLEWPHVKRGDNGLEGEVVRVDHFGNLITNIHRSDMVALGAASDLLIGIGSFVFRGVRETYSDVPPGEILALVGSSGFLEVAVNRGMASQFPWADTGWPEGTPVRVSPAKAHQEGGGSL